MVLLLGTNLPNNESVFIALTKIFGINIYTSKLLCKKLGFTDNLKVYELKEDQLDSLKKEIEFSNIIINNELRKLRNDLFKEKIKKKTYIGLRRLKGLPVRGQRTHTNSKNSKKKYK